MGQTTVRITETTRSALRELALDEERSMQAVLERAVEDYRRKRFLARVNEGYSAVVAEPRVWTRYQEELQALEATLSDGLAPEEWSDDGRALPPPRKKK